MSEENIVIVVEESQPVEIEVTEGGSLWGDIRGDITDQIDLQNALNDKADTDDLGDLAFQDKVDWDTEIDNIPASFPPAVHNHDDRYYTETETDTLLSAKADTADLGDLAEKDKVDWDTDIDNIPTSFPPESHNHDDRYYTETEVDDLLDAKQDTLTFDTAPTASSTNPVTSGGVKTALNDKANLASPVFTGNPQATTQSKGNNSKRIATTAFVQTAIGDKQDTLTFDSTPTANSTNPVTSGGIKTALDGKLDLHGTADDTKGVVTLLLGQGIDLNDLRPDNVTWYRAGSTGTSATILNKPFSTNEQFTMVVYQTGNDPRIQVLMRIDGIFYSRYYRNNTWTTWEQWYTSYQGVVNDVTGKPVTITDGASAPVVDLTVGIEPIQIGQNDPSPTNIRQILGWSESYITRTNGKNLWCSDWVIVGGPLKQGNIYKISSTSTVRSIVFPVVSGKTYTISKITSNRFRYAFTKVYPKVDVETTVIVSKDGLLNFSFTAPDDYCWFVCSVGNNESNIDAVLASVQIEEGSIATTYEAWQGLKVSITFPTEAGTVYSGSLDVTTGVLTVTHGQIASYDGETLPGAWISDRDVYAEGTTPTTGAQVVYELATPITYQLTPTEVTTLLGSNTISADTGAVNVIYRADTKAYIDNKIAESQRATRSLIAGIETEMIATKNYSVGDLLIVGDTLYKVTVNIATSGAITEGTNVTATTVAEQLILLANA